MKIRTVGLILFARLACGQDAASVPTFKATTRLVSVSVVAHDKQGKPVRDLRREDFQISDNGAPKELQLFVADTEDASAPSSPETSTQSSSTFSNQISSAKGSPKPYSVILIDSLFTPVGDPFKVPGSAMARAEALKMLRSIPDGEHIAIYSLGLKVGVICEFTTDRDLLERQLELWKPNAAGETTANLIPTGTLYHDDEATNAGSAPDLQAIARANAMRLDNQQRAEATMEMMNQVADHLAGIPGRKNLLWLAIHFAMSPRNLQKFNNAGVSVYPIDMQGVCFSLDTCAPGPHPLLDTIAAQTGGLAFYGRNDINVAMREAMDDGRSSYILGFYAPGEEATPQTHRIDVRVNRAGVETRYHRFYQTEAPRHAYVTKADMAKALNLPVDISDLPIKVTLTKTEDRLNVLATLDVLSLDLGTDHDLRTGKLELLARFTTADGIVQGDVISQTITLNLRPESYEASLKRGLGYKTELTLPAKAHDLKLLLANPPTGKLGTLTIPIDTVGTAEKRNGAVAR